MPEAPDPVTSQVDDDASRRAPAAVRDVRHWSARRWATVLHVVSLVMGFFVLLWIDRHQWFSGDEWAFILKRGLLGHSQLGLLQPHNEHWSTAPILIYRALFSVFGVRTYTPYLVVLLLFQVVVAHLLWRVMVRAGVQPLIATAAATVFMVLGGGWENLINPFQVSFLGSVAFGLAALLVMPERGGFQRRDVYGWILNVVALTFSGVGITMVLVVGGVAYARRGWRVAAQVVSVPGVVYLLWYAGWGRDATAVGQEPLSTALQHSPAFVWHGLVESVDATTGLAGSGAVLLILLAIWLVRVVRPEVEPWPIVFALALGAPVFLFLAGIRRSGLGTDAAAAPRYVWIVVALLLPVAALAASRMLDGRSLAVPAGLVATAVLLTVGLSTMNYNATRNAPTKQENERRLVAAAALLQSGAPVVSDFPLPELDPDITSGPLLAIARSGDLPNVAISATDRLDAATFLQLTGSVGGRASTATAGLATIDEVHGAEVTRVASRADCVTVSPDSDAPTVVLSFSEPGHLTARPEHGGVFTTQLEAVDGSARSLVRSWPVPGGERLVLEVSATEPRLRLTVPVTGDSTLCNVEAATS
jgi:hypothetical protein